MTYIEVSTVPFRTERAALSFAIRDVLTDADRDRGKFFVLKSVSFYLSVERNPADSSRTFPNGSSCQRVPMRMQRVKSETRRRQAQEGLPAITSQNPQKPAKVLIDAGLRQQGIALNRAHRRLRAVHVAERKLPARYLLSRTGCTRGGLPPPRNRKWKNIDKYVHLRIAQILSNRVVSAPPHGNPKQKNIEKYVVLRVAEVRSNRIPSANSGGIADEA